jgi:hypothetical protein
MDCREDGKKNVPGKCYVLIPILATWRGAGMEKTDLVKHRCQQRYFAEAVINLGVP